MAGTLGFYSYPKVLLRGQSQDLKTAITSMTKERGKEESEGGKETKTPKIPRESEAERQATATFREQGAIKFIFNLLHDNISIRQRK